MHAVTPAGAASGSWRHITRLVAIALLPVYLSGCASIPKDMARQLNSRGAHATFARRAGPLVQLETISLLPGSKAKKAATMRVDICTRDGAEVEIRALGPLVVEKGACQRIAESAAWAKRTVGGETIDISYVITFVPGGTSYQERFMSLSLGHSAKVGFTFVWFDGEGVASRRAAITVAHETSHIVAALQNDAARQLDERRAYWVGACASAAALGELSLDDFMTGTIDGDAMPESVVNSAGAGVVVASEISSLFDSGETLASAATLSRVASRCSSEIGNSNFGSVT
jgi:hypothetical protein